MTRFDPDDLAKWTGGEWTQRPSARLGGFSIDTRQIQRGQVFVALKTPKRDGHDFLAAAEAAGAAAALVARADSAVALPQLVVGAGGAAAAGGDTLRAFQKIARAQREKFQAAGGRVIGVTGSVGKTSTKNLLAALLGAAAGGAGGVGGAVGKSGAAQVLATEGNLNNHLGVPLTLTQLDPAQHRFAVVEAGISEPGEMAILAEMTGPDVAIITAVAAAHLAALGDVEGVAREKAILAASVRENGVAIFPAELRAFEPFKALRVPCLLANGHEGRALAAQTCIPREGNFTLLEHGYDHVGEETHLSLVGQYEPRETPHFFSLPPVSPGMANNAALAIRALWHLGLSPDRKIPWSAGSLRGEWRSQPSLSCGARIGSPSEFAGERLVYLDCYNANPASMSDALDAFYARAPEALPRLFVLGGMEELGPTAAMHHRALGRALRLRAQDRVLAIGTEAEALREGALESHSAAPGQIEVAGDLEAVRAEVAHWRGAIFLKASRRYRLETLLSAELSSERGACASAPASTTAAPFAHSRSH